MCVFSLCVEYMKLQQCASAKLADDHSAGRTIAIIIIIIIISKALTTRTI